MATYLLSALGALACIEVRVLYTTVLSSFGTGSRESPVGVYHLQYNIGLLLKTVVYSTLNQPDSALSNT